MVDIIDKNKNPNAPYYRLFFDGCSKGNPGSAGIGAVIYKDEHEIWSGSKYIGEGETNNKAEYMALIMGLEEAIKRHRRHNGLWR